MQTKQTTTILASYLVLASFLSLATVFLFYTTTAFSGEVRTSNSGILYTNGGIGEEEVTSLHQMAKDFSLNLVFSQGSGGKIIDVDVMIYNEQNVAVFSLQQVGPQLLVNLPAGKYRVVATYQGIKQSGIFTLDGNKSGNKNTKVILNWKATETEEIFTEDTPE